MRQAVEMPARQRQVSVPGVYTVRTLLGREVCTHAFRLAPPAFMRTSCQTRGRYFSGAPIGGLTVVSVKAKGAA